ncbi:MAG: hypothetical protein A2V98_13300 [Planctomycetes bacterium RBG_16_64_12]|nr:MAG: hypothetical protein A2V98_13300 [Planctomycetes bacterium RBG_16_64_12]
MQEPAVVRDELESESTAHMVHRLVQFAVTVRHRKNVVILALAVAAFLGALSYMTATRYYSASAGVWVLELGSSSAGSVEDNLHQTQLPTQVDIVRSDKVLDAAVRQLRPEDCIDFAGAPKSEWSKKLRDKLSVNALRNKNIITASYRSRDPDAAVSVVSAVVACYLKFTDSTLKGQAGEVFDVLSQEKNTLGVELSHKEQERLALRQQCGVLRVGPEGEVQHPLVQAAIALSEQLIESQSRRAKLEASLAAIEAAVHDGEDLEKCILLAAEVVGWEVLRNHLGSSADDGLQAALEKNLVDYRAEWETKRKNLGDNHPELIALEDKIRVTEQSLLEYPGRIRQRMQDAGLGPMLIGLVHHKLAEAQWLEATLQEDFQQAQNRAMEIDGQVARLDNLDREVERLRRLHDVLCDRINDLDLSREGQQICATLLDEPRVNRTPVSPNLARTVLAVLTLGLGLGLGAVYILDILDDRFRSREEMQSVLGVPALAIVQELKMNQNSGIDQLPTYASPNAAEVEAFRTLRTALSLANQETHQLVVSSAEPGDGKTTVLANLAVAIAQSGKKTLLIDADLRRPGLTALMAMRGIEGLSSVIRSEEDIVRAAVAHIRPSGLAGLDVLASGPRPSNPAELLSSQRFSELLAWAESVYDQILIDSPPVLAASDTAVIGRLTSGVVLVVQPAKNRRRAVMRCVENLSVLKIPLLGIVLNRIGSEKEGGYYGYGYGGYGYGYIYKYGADADSKDESELAEAAAIGKDAAGAQGNGVSRWKEADPPPGLVPRRVA